MSGIGSAMCSGCPPSAGGIFGLLGGWLIDRFGRKTVMIGSIFVYSLSPVAGGPEHQSGLAWCFSAAPPSSACALSSSPPSPGCPSCFTDKRQRELVIGWTQAFASVGGLFVTGVSVAIGSLVQKPFAARAARRRPHQSGLALHAHDRPDSRNTDRPALALRPGIGGLAGAETKRARSNGPASARFLRPACCGPP